jgi:hypothetical protein
MQHEAGLLSETMAASNQRWRETCSAWRVCINGRGSKTPASNIADSP